tara:strand:+ start:2286 stop:3419 length:1134 start_codon:yes stop_codon:yes gene_type:complete
MATFEEQVEALTSLSLDGSSAPTQSELSQFLTDGAKEVLNALPRMKQSLFTTSNDLDSSSTYLTLGGSEVFSVTRDDGTINQPCRAVRAELGGKIRDADDMMAATVTDPAYYITNGILSVVPEPTNSQNAHVQTLNYPTVAFGDTAITKFPDDAEYLVVLYGAIKSLQNKLSTLIKSDLSLSTPPTLASADFTVPTIANVTIGSFGTAPVYTAPVVAGETEELTATLTHDATADNTKLDFSDWFEVVGDFIQTDEDVELASSQLQKISIYLNAYSQAMQNKLNIFNDANVEYQANIQKEIEQARINAQDSQQEASLKLQKEVQEYQAKVSEYQAEVNTDVQVYIQNLNNASQSYKFYSQLQIKLQADYDKGLQALVA